MSDEAEVATTTVESVKKMSDGTVKLSIEKYNELLETVANQKGSMRDLREQLSKARNQPPVINRTVVNKTEEMLSQEHRAWGGTLMGAGASLFVVGVLRYRRA